MVNGHVKVNRSTEHARVMIRVRVIIPNLRFMYPAL